MAGLTDTTVPRRLGPKRANRIRKLFNLSKEDDVRQYVVRRQLPVKEGKEGKKPIFKVPKIQRLITPKLLQRKRERIAEKRKRAVRRKEQATEYAKLLAKRAKEIAIKKKEKEKEKRLRKRTNSKSSKKSRSRTSSKRTSTSSA